MKPMLAPLALVLPYLEGMYSAGVFANHGPLVQALEGRFADWFDVKPDQVVVTANATIGLTVAATVSDGEEIIVPEWTFPATALAAVATRKPLGLRDVDPRTWMISPTAPDLSRMATIALMPVMPHGAPIELEKWRDWPHVVIDGAASVGSRRSLAALPPDWSVVVSLHATKVLGCGEGGVVIFGSTEKASLARQWINFGFSGDRTPAVVGSNGKMSEVGAAFALAALDNWAVERAEWEHALGLAEAVHNDFSLMPPPSPFSDIKPYWNVDFASPELAQRVERVFAAHNIGTRRWWPSAISATKAFSSTQTSGGSVAGALASRVVGLPMYRQFDDAAAARVRAALAESLGS